MRGGDFLDPAHVASVVDVVFFSSRRRHTRLQGDWSSDVCSSDLGYTLDCFVASLLAMTEDGAEVTASAPCGQPPRPAAAAPARRWPWRAAAASRGDRKSVV